VNSLQRGLSRIQVNEAKLSAELEEHYELLAEPVQTVMRKYDIPNPYEVLKDFTRGKATVNREDYLEFIRSLQGLPDHEKQMLLKLTPSTYTGAASFMA